MTVYGYVRVSSKDQNEDRQMIAMREFGVLRENIFIDKSSGKDFNRAEYQRMKEILREGDLLCVKHVDRFGRNYDEIREQWRILTKEKKIYINVLDLPILDTRCDKDLTRTFLSDVVLELLAFLSETERENIRQRQAEGIAAAKAQGKNLGRPSHPIPDDFDEVVRAWEEGRMTTNEILDHFSISRSTFYRLLNSRKKEGAQ